jgi:hypothetical protein
MYKMDMMDMVEAWKRLVEDDKKFEDSLTMEEVNSLDKFTFRPVGGETLRMQSQHGAGAVRKTKLTKKITRVRKDDMLKKTVKTNRKMTVWLIKKPVSSMNLDFGFQEMEVEAEGARGVANVVNGGTVPHLDVVQYHVGIRLTGGRRVVARKRQDDWWMYHSISNVLEVVMESI